MSSEEEKPKIISDEDWKAEAKQAKEKLKQEEDKAEAEGAGGPMGPLPPANFLGLVNLLLMQAFLYMGRLTDPNHPDAKSMVNLDLAKHNIDLLGVLEEKTKDNLTDEESRTLSMALHEVRMQYVQAASS